MGQISLILGGARSGKSELAERLAAERAEQVVYIATAEAGDEEMRRRIALHQQHRPANWRTLEATQDVAAAVERDGGQAELYLLDSLTVLVSNVYLAAVGDLERPNEAAARKAVDDGIKALLRIASKGDGNWLVVSDEVGLGVVPPYPSGRLFRDLMGRANRRLADAAAEVYLVLAGMAVPLHEVGFKLGE